MLVDKFEYLGNNCPRMLLVPYLQIRANSVVSYTINEERNYHRSIQNLLTENLRKQETYTGVLCPGAKKRLTKAIDLMAQVVPVRQIYNPVSCRIQPFQMAFVTLTMHSPDKMVKGRDGHKQCLEPFIKWLRQNHGCKSYLWKAELQKRGQLHYHMLIDVFVHHKAMRDKWNELNMRAGFLDKFYAKHGHYNANSVDVHTTKKKVNKSGYLKKEIAKHFQNDKSIGGKIWDCSMNLKKAQYFKVVGDSVLDNRLYEAVMNHEARLIKTDTCYIYDFNHKPASSILHDRDLTLYNTYLDSVRTHSILHDLGKEIKTDRYKEAVNRKMILIEFTKQEIKQQLSAFSNNNLAEIQVIYEPERFCSS